MKQAPAWNSITKAFASNDGVAFGDINLSEQQIRGNHNPGAGGWPTIRYFNQETGYEGHAYDKKTSKAMCDELGDEEMMQAYIEEAGGVSLCSAANGSGCSEKEVGSRPALAPPRVLLASLLSASSTSLHSPFAPPKGRVH